MPLLTHYGSRCAPGDLSGGRETLASLSARATACHHLAAESPVDEHGKTR